jgi:hypothetical protein
VQELDTTAARSAAGTKLDPVAAQARAEAYLASTGYQGTVSVHDDTVLVDVTISRHTFLLGLVGASDASVTAHGEARGARGIRGEGD